MLSLFWTPLFLLFILFSLTEQRIHLFLKCCLSHGMRKSLLDFPGGLLFIEPELAELGWKFVNLMHYNKHVFSPYYAEILKISSLHQMWNKMKKNLSDNAGPESWHEESEEMTRHTPRITSSLTNNYKQPSSSLTARIQLQGPTI